MTTKFSDLTDGQVFIIGKVTMVKLSEPKEAAFPCTDCNTKMVWNASNFWNTVHVCPNIDIDNKDISPNRASLY